MMKTLITSPSAAGGCSCGYGSYYCYCLLVSILCIVHYNPSTTDAWILQRPALGVSQNVKATTTATVTTPLQSLVWKTKPRSTIATAARYQQQQQLQQQRIPLIVRFAAMSKDDDGDEEEYDDEEDDVSNDYDDDDDEEEDIEFVDDDLEDDEEDTSEDEDFEEVELDDDDLEEEVEDIIEPDEVLDEADILVAKSLRVADEEVDLEEEDGDDDDVEEEEDLVEEIETEYDDEMEVEQDELEEATSTYDEEWDDDDDYSADFTLEDDPEDPDYTKQKEILENSVAESDSLDRDRFFDPLDYMLNQMTPEEMEQLDRTPFNQQAKTMAEQIQLTEEDVQDLDIEEELKNTPDLMDDDPYPRHEDNEINFLEANTGITDDDMEALDQAWKLSKAAQAEIPWDKVMLREQQGLEGLSNETLAEMEACLDEIGGSAYNSTRWLLYDLDFNVENLMLAATKHNRDAPILFQHWYPQLVTYSRYESAQARNFDYTWKDVENADISELERYYKGMGYDEIPSKAPAETGIIEFDYLDEEEIKMAAFETWVKDVYNPEWDRKDFDDDEFRDEDNVFSRFFESPQHPDEPTFEESQEDIEAWRDEIGTDEELAGNKEGKAYRDYMARELQYEVVDDKEFEEEFRGHLIVACTGNDSDLEIAEKITAAMDKAFGKQIYVETRLIAHAREEDNVFEVWIESYEIELLHSKKRATSNAKGWDGPADCNDEQIDRLVDRVRFLISDDARYSYSLEFDDAVL